MTKEKSYAELVAQAEKAVAAVKDPDLKNIAFQRVLDDLLNQDPKSAKNGPVPSKRKNQGKNRTSTKKTVAGKGPQAQVEELIGEGFFKKQKTIVDVKTELATRGYHIPQNFLSMPLQRLCQKKKLRREQVKDKENDKGKKKIYRYSNW